MRYMLVALSVCVISTTVHAACPKQSSLGNKKFSSFIELYANGHELQDICLLRGSFNARGTRFTGTGYCTLTPEEGRAFTNTINLSSADFDRSTCIARVTGQTSSTAGEAVITGTTTFSNNGKNYDFVGITGEGIRIVERGVLQ